MWGDMYLSVCSLSGAHSLHQLYNSFKFKQEKNFFLSTTTNEVSCLFLGHARKTLRFAFPATCGCYFHSGVCWQLQSCLFLAPTNPLLKVGFRVLLQTSFLPVDLRLTHFQLVLHGFSVIYPQVWSSRQVLIYRLSRTEGVPALLTGTPYRTLALTYWLHLWPLPALYMCMLYMGVLGR